jgi:hypothetical protein
MVIFKTKSRCLASYLVDPGKLLLFSVVFQANKGKKFGKKITGPVDLTLNIPLLPLPLILPKIQGPKPKTEKIL